MCLLANQWLKTATKTNLGYATTFTTTLDYQEKPDKPNRGKKDKRKKNNEEKKASDKSSEKSEKKERDMNKVECFACGENGHFANKCPTRQNNKEEDKERSAHLTWNENTFTTYQVNAVQQNTFGPKDVLLDNQANISVVRPELLRDVQDAEQEVKINGVGGHQFTVIQTG